MNRDKIQLGDLVKDSVTGFSGIAIALTNWLNGCQRVTIQARELKDGKPIDSHCFDVEQCEILTSQALTAQKPSGGPMPSPKQF